MTKTSDKRPTEADILALLPKYTGVIMQTPPQFSAIKIAGERAYDLARDGETVDIPPREVEIGRLELMETTPEGHSVFEIECGKGTYVRSLARDFGRDLGCFGHVATLRRTEVDPFTAEDLVLLSDLEAAAPKREEPAEEGQPFVPQRERFAAIDAFVVDTGAALDCLPQVAITDDAAAKLRLGNAIILRGRDAPVDAEEACATARGRLVAIGAIEAGMFRPKRVFAG